MVNRTSGLPREVAFGVKPRDTAPARDEGQARVAGTPWLARTGIAGA
jgi:hypothetical protein